MPRFEDDLLYEQVDVTVTLLGVLPLPSRMFGISDLYGLAKIFPAAGAEAEVLTVTAWGRVAAWLVRVPGSAAVSWTSVGFEDECVVGDAGAGELGLRIVDGGWPHERVAFAQSSADTRIVCASDSSTSRGQLGFDAHGQVTALVVI